MSHSDARALKALEKIANMSGGPPFQPREVLMRKIARDAVASITEPAPILPDPKTAADNAALIAAIPEMINLLSEMALHFEMASSGFIAGCGSDEEWCKKQDELIAEARALLQKVKQP